MIANFGCETTELSVLAGGGMVLNRLVKVGGLTFDQGIINLVKHSHDFLIGRRRQKYFEEISMYLRAIPILYYRWPEEI